MKNVKPVWEKARGHYHFPSLKEPRVVGKLEGGACYDFKKRETLVDENFVEDLSQKSGLTTEDCLEGIFIHEIGHYMVFPRTLGTLVLAAKMIDDFFGKHDLDTRETILQLYADMSTDTASVLEEQRTEPILKIREGLQFRLDDELNANVRAVMLAYLHHQAGRQHKLPEELRPYLERMLEIDFLNENVEKMRQGIWTFGNIVVDMVKKYAASGGGILPMTGHIDSDIRRILKRATRGEIREALREISYKITKGEYERVREWLKDSGVRLPKGAKPFSIGTSKGELEVDAAVVEYYKELSKQYPLVVSKKLVETDSTARVWSETKKWRPGEDPNLALPVTSGGKFMPDVTRSVRIDQRPIKSTDYRPPHLLVVIDSSGSTPDPKVMKSYLVLGGHCAARSYHIQGSYIGVINFSGESFYLPYTRELDEALGAVSAYQGGGTVADVEMIKKMLGPEMAELYAKNPDRNLKGLPKEAIKKEISIAVPDEVFSAESLDVVMFTDGGIYNLDEVLELFEERAELNRATIVLTPGFNQEIEKIRSSKINVHELETEKDIPGLVIKETQKSFNALAWVDK